MLDTHTHIFSEIVVMTGTHCDTWKLPVYTGLIHTAKVFQQLFQVHTILRTYCSQTCFVEMFSSTCFSSKIFADANLHNVCAQTSILDGFCFYICELPR